MNRMIYVTACRNNRPRSGSVATRWLGRLNKLAPSRQRARHESDLSAASERVQTLQRITPHAAVVISLVRSRSTIRPWPDNRNEGLLVLNAYSLKKYGESRDRSKYSDLPENLCIAATGFEVPPINSPSGLHFKHCAFRAVLRSSQQVQTHERRHQAFRTLPWTSGSDGSHSDLRNDFEVR